MPLLPLVATFTKGINMNIQFFSTRPDLSQVVCIIREAGTISRYLITCAPSGDCMGQATFINGRGYYIDRVGATFASSVEQDGNFIGLSSINPHILVAVASLHGKGK